MHGAHGGLGARRRTSEGGSASVVLVSLVAVTLALAVLVGAVTTAHAGRLQAQTAADLAALAGASDLRRGGDACATARRAAARNGARLVACADEGAGVVRVVAECGTRVGTASATARAGPSPRS